MNGPEHYREAEHLLAKAKRWESDIQDDTDSYESINSARLAAQVHATLALAAATAEGIIVDAQLALRDTSGLAPWIEALS